MIGEDYQVFLSDGRALGQVLVLGCGDPTAGGKQGAIALKIQLPSLLLKIYCIVTETCNCSRSKLWPAPEIAMWGSGKLVAFVGRGGRAKTFIFFLFCCHRQVC